MSMRVNFNTSEELIQGITSGCMLSTKICDSDTIEVHYTIGHSYQLEGVFSNSNLNVALAETAVKILGLSVLVFTLVVVALCIALCLLIKVCCGSSSSDANEEMKVQFYNNRPQNRHVANTTRYV